jgi:hypothetical protein
LILFIGAGFAVNLLFWIVTKLLIEDETVSWPSSIGGAVLGSVVGVLLAIVIVWTYALLRDIRPTTKFDTATQTSPSEVEHLVSKVAGKAVNTAMSLSSAEPEVARLSAALVESPAEIGQQAQRLIQSQDLAALLQDPNNQAILNSGDTAALQQLPAFQQLVKNPDLQALASSAGMLDRVAVSDQTVEAELAIQLTDIWSRMQRLKNDARMQEILADPEFQRKIQSGNPMELLTNPRLLELADIIFSDSAASENTAAPDDTSTKPKSEKKLYSWTDEGGTIHYSDVDPDS